MAYKYLNDNGLKAYTKKVKEALKDLHTPIAISRENTTKSNAQNVKNMADFIAKAKAAGIADVNGMAVTCLIDDDYSGVGYLYGTTNTNICGIISYDDVSNPYTFGVNTAGEYIENEVLTATATNLVTSSMLAQGARKPIILTQKTTEVDEETYQKLLSDDVDVVFKTADDEYCALTIRFDADETVWEYYFTCFSVEGETIGDIFIYSYKVSIAKAAPHTCTVFKFYAPQTFDGLIEEAGFPNKSDLSPVLKEIDLTGTDAQRKARLDKFEADWKALTDASDLTGARFVGNFGIPGDDVTRNVTGIMTYCVGDDTTETNDNCFYGICNGYSFSKQKSHIAVKVSCTDGSLIITPLFSHLEPVEIFFDNTAEKKKKNIDNLNAYKSNLEDLGMDISNGYSVLVRITGNAQEYHGMLNIGTGALLSGIVTDANENHHYPFNVSTADGAITFDTNNYFLEKTSNEVTEMLDAIKYSYTQVPLTTTISTNKAQLEVFLSKVPTAQVMHVTYKDVYAGTLHKINGNWFGLLVKNTNNYEDALQVKLQADGTLIEGTTSLARVNAKLDTIIG